LAVFLKRKDGLIARLLTTQNNKKSKVKLSHYTPWRRLGGEEYSSYSLTTLALDGRDSPAALYPRGKGLRYPLNSRLSGPQSRSGHRG